MTAEDALRNILMLVDGSEATEDVHLLQMLLESIKTLVEKGLATCHARLLAAYGIV